MNTDYLGLIVLLVICSPVIAAILVVLVSLFYEIFTHEEDC